MLTKLEAKEKVKSLLREIADEECFKLDYDVGWYVLFADDRNISIETLVKTTERRKK